MQMPAWQVQTGLNPRNLKLVHLLGHFIKIDVFKNAFAFNSHYFKEFSLIISIPVDFSLCVP